MDGRVYGTSQNCCSRASGANWGLISSVAQLRANFYCCTQFLLVGPMEANFFGLTLCSCIESSVTIQKTLEQKRTTITGRPTTLLIHVFYNKELQSNDTNVRNKRIVRPFVNLSIFFCWNNEKNSPSLSLSRSLSVDESASGGVLLKKKKIRKRFIKKGGKN